MICENCGENNAVLHIKNNVNGQTRELRLCPECAKKLGFGEGVLSFDIGSLLSGIMGAPVDVSPMATRRADAVCPFCGATFRDIERAGKMGCAECYDTFRDLIMPSVQRIHGNVQYEGSIPESAGKRVTQARKLRELSNRLQEAINSEEYEKAAELRDQIRALSAEDAQEADTADTAGDAQDAGKGGDAGEQ